jgi:hypothetical protein
MWAAALSEDCQVSRNRQYHNYRHSDCCSSSSFIVHNKSTTQCCSLYMHSSSGDLTLSSVCLSTDVTSIGDFAFMDPSTYIIDQLLIDVSVMNESLQDLFSKLNI